MSLALILVIVFGSGLASGLIIGLKLRRTLSSRTLSASTEVSDLIIDTKKTALTDESGNAILHDLRTPINMILGYCDVLLNPASASARSLPALAREDVTSIARNARQLQTLIEQLFTDPPITTNPVAPLPTTSKSPALALDPPDKGTVLVFHADPLVVAWLQSHIPDTEIIYTRTIADLGQLPLNQTSVRLVITDADEPAIPEIAALVGDQIPIISGLLPDTRRTIKIPNTRQYLSKPVTYQALAMILAAFTTPIQTVLIIDDNQDNVEMVSRMLIDIDATCQVWKAYTGREGLALMREQPPDLVIIDVLLPDLNGLMITHYMRTVPPLADIPVILVSAQRDSDITSLNKPIQLALMRLGGFSYDDVDRLFKTLMA